MENVRWHSFAFSSSSSSSSSTDPVLSSDPSDPTASSSSFTTPPTPSQTQELILADSSSTPTPSSIEPLHATFFSSSAISGNNSSSSSSNSTSASSSSSLQAPETSQQPKQPCWKHRYFRFVVYRILLRAIALVALYFIVRTINWKILVNGYINWIESFHPWPLIASLLFLIVVIPFVTFVPGSYAPTVLAGITFGYWLGFILSYIAVNIGAMLNFAAVRGALRPCFFRLLGERVNRFGNFEKINLILKKYPIRTVILFRLPYLGAGIINYVCSLSVVEFKPMVLGNLVGFIPGVFLFAVVGGQVRSLTDAFLHGGDKTAAIITLVIVTVLVAISLIAIILTVRRVTRKEIAAQEQAVSPVVEADDHHDHDQPRILTESQEAKEEEKGEEKANLIIRHRHLHAHGDAIHDHEHEHVPGTSFEMHSHSH